MLDGFIKYGRYGVVLAMLILLYLTLTSDIGGSGFTPYLLLLSGFMLLLDGVSFIKEKNRFKGYVFLILSSLVIVDVIMGIIL